MNCRARHKAPDPNTTYRTRPRDLEISRTASTASPRPQAVSSAPVAAALGSKPRSCISCHKARAATQAAAPQFYLLLSRDRAKKEVEASAEPLSQQASTDNQIQLRMRCLRRVHGNLYKATKHPRHCPEG